MSVATVRTVSGANHVRWDAAFRLYGDLPPETEGARARHSDVARDCWLYIFDPLGPLLYEVYADKDGMYHEVDLTKHAGKNIRPFALEGKGVVPTLPLVAGQRTSKGIVVIHHWILISPSQLPWSRFPHVNPDEVADGLPHGGFRTWAQSTRELDHFVPCYDKVREKFEQEVEVECPRLHAMALNQCFQIAQQQWIGGFLNDSNRLQRKTLRSYVRSIESIVGKDRFERDMLDLIDKLAFETEDRLDKEKEAFPPEALVKARAALVTYLKSPRFLAMRDDALASPDPRARATFAQILASAEEGLEGVAGDPKYREAVFRDNQKLFEKETEQVSNEVKAFLDQNPDALYDQPETLAWKEQRKAAKSCWYLIKAYISQIESVAPRRLTRELKFIGREVFGVLVDFDFADGTAAKRMPDGSIRWPRLVVSPQAKARLAEKYSSRLEWNAFFVVLDAYNLLRACQDQAKGKTDMKPVVAAMGSFLNTVAAAVEATMSRHGTKYLIVTDKMLAELAEDAGRNTARRGGNTLAVMLRRFNTPKTIGVIGKAFGMLGSVSEMFGQLQEARKSDAGYDPDSALAHRVSAGANAAVSVGYFLGFCGTIGAVAVGTTVAWPLALVAVGSWLVAGGTITDLGAKLVLMHLKKDPLENWLKVTPWALETKYRMQSFDEQVKAFYKALVGLHVNIRTGLTGFDVTVESRVIQSPEQVFLEIEWKSDAGRMKNEMAPMTPKEYLAPNQFRHQEMTSPLEWVSARVRLYMDGEWYPDRPEVFNYPG